MTVMRHDPGGGTIAQTHPTAQCFFIIDGKALFQVGDEVRTVEKGAIIFVPSNILHQYKTLGDQPFTEIIVSDSLEGLRVHTQYPNLTWPELLSQTEGKGKIDVKKIREESGGLNDVIIDERTSVY